MEDQLGTRTGLTEEVMGSSEEESRLEQSSGTRGTHADQHVILCDDIIQFIFLNNVLCRTF